MPDNDFSRYEFDFQSEDFMGVADDAISQVTGDAEGLEGISEDALSEFYNVEDEMLIDPRDAASREQISPEELPEVQADLTGWVNYQKMVGLMQEGNKQVALNGKLAAEANLTKAEAEIVLTQTDNKHKLNLQAYAQGQLIDEKTKGIVLQGVHQQVLNSREYQMIQMSMDETEALKAAKVQKIRTIGATAQAEALKAFKQSMQTLGVDVSGYLPPNAQ